MRSTSAFANTAIVIALLLTGAIVGSYVPVQAQLAMNSACKDLKHCTELRPLHSNCPPAHPLCVTTGGPFFSSCRDHVTSCLSDPWTYGTHTCNGGCGVPNGTGGYDLAVPLIDCSYTLDKCN